MCNCYESRESPPNELKEYPPIIPVLVTAEAACSQVAGLTTIARGILSHNPHTVINMAINGSIISVSGMIGYAACIGVDLFIAKDRGYVKPALNNIKDAAKEYFCVIPDENQSLLTEESTEGYSTMSRE